MVRRASPAGGERRGAGTTRQTTTLRDLPLVPPGGTPGGAHQSPHPINLVSFFVSAKAQLATIVNKNLPPWPAKPMYVYFPAAIGRRPCQLDAVFRVTR